MTLSPGTTLGPYTILAELGHGGMGIVYTALDPRLDRQVAIKVLPPDLTRDATAKQRFLQEAKAASALDHPNICTIHEINETEGGQLYLPRLRCEHARSSPRCTNLALTSALRAGMLGTTRAVGGHLRVGGANPPVGAGGAH